MSSARPVNQRAWWFVLPVLISVAFSALVPLMTIVNYSVQDILGPDQAVFVGMEWYQEILRDPDLHGAFWRSSRTFDAMSARLQTTGLRRP